MSAKRIQIPTGMMRGMAKVAAEFNVTVTGSVDSLNVFKVEISPGIEARTCHQDDDLDSKLLEFARK